MEILTIVSLLSGPAVAIIAIFGLKQIKESKNQVIESKRSRVLNSKREAFKIAAEKCSFYLERIIPVINEIDKKIEDEKIGFFERIEVKVVDNHLESTPYFINEEEREKVKSLEMGVVLNHLESFSLFFTSGVADESIGYLTLGHTFCGTIKFYLPMICIVSGGRHYKNLIELYILWNSRIEKEFLEIEKNKIEQKLAGKSNRKINPIGTEKHF